MSAEPLTPVPVSPRTPVRVVRVEYVDFHDVGDYREFRFRVRVLDGAAEVRARIAVAAFGPGRMRLQDGPDLCYRKVVEAVAAAGDTATPETITIEETDLAGYAEGHKTVQKHRSWSSPSPEVTATAAPADPAAPPAARRTAAATPAPAPVLEGGQRVCHPVFGLGVMSPPSGGRTVVCFDQDGPRTFVTALLEVDVLSAPHTWETTARGKNRPCATAGR
jgi:hypothetical protein